MISFLSLAVFEGGKYLARNFWANSFQVLIDPVGREFNQSLALSLKEKGNNLNLIASSDTPLYLKVAQISKKLVMCKLRSSIGPPQIESFGSFRLCLVLIQNYWLKLLV